MCEVPNSMNRVEDPGEINNDNELDRLLTCTMCGERQETHSEIVYSRGNRVCLECKTETQEGDNNSFDRDMKRREVPQMIAT